MNSYLTALLTDVLCADIEVNTSSPTTPVCASLTASGLQVRSHHRELKFSPKQEGARKPRASVSPGKAISLSPWHDFLKS